MTRVWRHRVDRVVTAALAGAAGSVVVVALVILGFMGRAGVQGFAESGFFAMVLGRRWHPQDLPPLFGFLPFLFGTAISALGAVLLGAVPAVLAAVCASEFGSPRLRLAFRRVLETAAALPSVVYGYVAITWVVPRLANPHTGCQGLGIATASVLLAAMITPTVALLSLDALARVPGALRDASAALGASRWQTTWRAVVPTAWRGLLVAGFFGFARAAGETMAVQMVAGNGDFGPMAILRPPGARVMSDACPMLGPLELFRPTSTISTRIVMDLPNTQPGTPWNHALFSMSLVLLGMSTGVVLVTRWLARRAAS